MARSVHGNPLPSESRSNGSLNESTPIAQRSPEGAPVGEGPKVGERGEYLPASYAHERVTNEATGRKVTITRTDR